MIKSVLVLVLVIHVKVNVTCFGVKPAEGRMEKV